MYELPLPITDHDAAAYYAGLKAHKLMLPRCTACAKFHFYPRELCPHCHSDALEWQEASGLGEIYTYTVARRPAGPAFKPLVPYIVAVVQLAEGPRMMANLPGVAPEAVRIGTRVRMTFDDVTPEMTLPRFALA